MKSRSLPKPADFVTRSLGLVTSASVLRLLLGLVSSVLIVRMLGPSDYGVFALLAALCGIVGVVADFGFSGAAVKRVGEVVDHDPPTAVFRERSFFAVRMYLLFVVVAVTALFGRPLLAFLHLDGASGYLAFALLGVLATGVSGAIATLLQIHERFQRLSIVLVANSLLTAVLALLLAYSGWLNLATALLVLGVGTSLVSVLLGLGRSVPGRLGRWVGDTLPDGHGVGWRWFRRPEAPPPHTPAAERSSSHSVIEQGPFRREFNGLWAFGRWIGVVQILGMLVHNVDLFVLQRSSNAGEMSLYALALSLSAKANVLSQSQHTVLLPHVSRLREEGERGAYLRRSLRGSLWGVLLLVPLGFFSGPLIGGIYGAEFRAAAPWFCGLLVVAALELLTQPLLLLAYPLNRPKLLVGVECSRLIVFLILVALLLPRYGVWGVVLAKGIAKLLSVAVLWASLRGRMTYPQSSS